METPAHLTEGVWDSAETGNNHWGKVVKAIKRNVGHVRNLRSPAGVTGVLTIFVADNSGDGGGFRHLSRLSAQRAGCKL